MRRGALVAALGLGLAGCTPDVPSGVYYCGPERSCPNDLVCDDATAVCVREIQAEPFECGEDAELLEPDDTLELANDFDVRGCGFQAVLTEGCIDHTDDVDHIAMVSSVDCDARPFVATIRYPVAFAPVGFELLDEQGEVLTTGEVCLDLDELGQEHTCIETSVPESVALYLRMRLFDDAPGCDGRCRYNRYRLSIQ